MTIYSNRSRQLALELREKALANLTAPRRAEWIIRSATADNATGLDDGPGSHPAGESEVARNGTASGVSNDAGSTQTIRVGVIDYKDVATLRKFISDRGKTRSRRITGVSIQEQRLIAAAVRNAREMAILPRDTDVSIGAATFLVGDMEFDGVIIEPGGDTVPTRPATRRATQSKKESAGAAKERGLGSK